MKFKTHQIKRIVVKVGSNVLSDEKGLKVSFFSHLAEQIAHLKKQNVEVVIVSSGAVSTAMSVFKAPEMPKSIPSKQAFAAFGQPLLMQTYAQAFQKQNLQVAQILLTHPDLENRKRYLNAKHVFEELLVRDLIPVVNENDSVVVEELKFGDNDRLSAYVAGLVEADLLVILSHVNGVYDKNPAKYSDANLIPTIEDIEEAKSYIYQNQNQRGTGGMLTKLEAAQICQNFGISCFLTEGSQKNVLVEIMEKEVVGTFFPTKTTKMSARKNWIKEVLKTKGCVYVDDGAEKALLKNNRSLLPSGVMRVSGKFDTGECVEVRNAKEKVLVKGLTIYASWELEKICGKKSSEIEMILGYKYSDEVIHRDDLVVVSI